MSQLPELDAIEERDVAGFDGQAEKFSRDELSRLRCARCHAHTASEQWGTRACAEGGEVVWVPLCVECDCLLNDLLLGFFRVDGWQEKAASYRARKMAALERVEA